MIICDECGASQYEGVLFCSECGRFLHETSVDTTSVLPFSQFTLRAVPTPLTDYELTSVAQPKHITFVIPSSRHRSIIELTDQIRVGRSDPSSETWPELDLTEHQGAEKGVSRIHASFQLSNKGLILVDLDSTNGTLLNDSRLSAEQPYLVQSGDEILFGDLLVHIFFEL